MRCRRSWSACLDWPRKMLASGKDGAGQDDPLRPGLVMNLASIGLGRNVLPISCQRLFRAHLLPVPPLPLLTLATNEV